MFFRSRNLLEVNEGGGIIGLAIPIRRTGWTGDEAAAGLTHGVKLA
jgi:hypothetical protein